MLGKIVLTSFLVAFPAIALAEFGSTSIATRISANIGRSPSSSDRSFGLTARSTNTTRWQRIGSATR